MKTKRLTRRQAATIGAFLTFTATLPVWIGPSTAQELVVSNADSVTVYGRTASANTYPLRTPATFPPLATHFSPKGVVVDTVNNELVIVALYHFVSIRISDVRVYNRTADGNPAPIRTIGGVATGLNDAAGVAVDTANDELFVANPGNVPLTVPDAKVVVFDRTASGDVAPIRTLAGAATGLDSPTGLVVDTVHNELLVVNTTGGTVTVYDRTASGNTAPIRTLITTAATGGAMPTAIALDPANNELLVTNRDDTVTVYSRTASGTTLPIRTLNLPAGSQPAGVTVDTVNNELFVASEGSLPFSSNVTVYSRTASGSATPIRVLVGTHTGLGAPQYPVVTTSPPPRHTGSTAVGLFRPVTPTFYLWNGTASGAAPDDAFALGATDDVPVAGDWNGDGITTGSVFRPATNTFYFLNSNTGGVPYRRIAIGAPGDLPIAGDWDGDGTTTIGLFRPSTNTFYLWNNFTPGGRPDVAVTVGAPGDLPIAGDWDGNGTTTIGLFRPSTNTFYLWNNFTPGSPPDVAVTVGAPGDLPIAGDWDGNGTTTIGLFRPGTNSFYLWNSFTSGGVPDVAVSVGAPGDLPIAGDWDGL